MENYKWLNSEVCTCLKSSIQECNNPSGKTKQEVFDIPQFVLLNHTPAMIAALNSLVNS